MPVRYLLDTNICIYIAKQNSPRVAAHFEQLEVGEICMSTITYGELLYGAEKSQHRKKTLDILHQIASLIPPFPIPTEAVQHYGEIRGKLEKQGKLIGNNDLWIAAHALALRITLVTNNETEFRRIPRLKVENWA